MSFSFNEKIPEIQKLQQSSDNKISESTLTFFFNAISKLKNWNTLRINPIDFAEKNNIDIDETIKMFIYGAKAGIFTFEWNLLCPLCGGREHSYHSLNQLEKETYHCTLCDVDVEVEADKHLEVSFSIPKSISGFSPLPYGSLDEYWSFFFSPFIVWTPEINKAFGEQPKLRFVAINPGEKATIPIDLTPIKRHRISTFDTHSIFTAHMLGNTNYSSQTIELVHTENGFEKKEEEIGGVAGEVVIDNRVKKTVGFIIGSPDSAYIGKVIHAHPPYFKPFLSGKMVLNNQIFRDLFLVDNLPDDLSLKINDITLLFTDLKGSTELYEKTGDVRAYKLVQNHFKILQRIVHSHRGGIVKTMGDAIMASFNIPLDGIKASFSMIEEIKAFNKSLSDFQEAIGLKVGLHRGNVIAVKANQTLDYFGQTVNIAARVQGLADSQEIWITDEIMNDENTGQFIKASGYNVLEKEVLLKGVKNFVKTYLCYK